MVVVLAPFEWILLVSWLPLVNDLSCLSLGWNRVLTGCPLVRDLAVILLLLNILRREFFL